MSKEAPAVPASHVGSKPSKILNISVNVNTWKSPGMVQETHSFSLQNNKVSKAENTEVCFLILFLSDLLLRYSVISLCLSLATIYCTCMV